MAEQSRSFRKFILDPKSSVMTYIADNIPQAHQQGEPGFGGPHHNSIAGQQADAHDPTRIQQNLGQSHANLSQSSIGHPQNPYQPNPAISQTTSPQPAYAQQAQNLQEPFGQAYITSNLNQPVPKPTINPILQSVPRPDPPQWQIGGQSSMQDPMGHKNAQNVNSLPGGPPPAGARRVTSPQSAQRQYHRMVLDFERAKNGFSIAQSRRLFSLYPLIQKADQQSEHDFQAMASAAYELEAQSRRIWSLRVEHAWEFEGFTEASHQSVISGWQAQFELWADTVLDIQEGHFDSSDTKPGSHDSSLMSTTSEGWGQQRRQEINSNVGADSKLPANMPVQAPQMPQIQNLSVGQNSPPQQNMPYPGLAQPTPPGAFPQSSPAGPNETSVNPGMSMGQQQPGPQLQQMPMGQSTTTNMAFTGQNGQSMQQPGSLPNQQTQSMPSGQGSYQQAQNTPQGGVGFPQQGQSPPSGVPIRGPGPNNQQGQNMPPGSNGYAQQGQTVPPGGGPKMQQRQNIAQGPPPNMQQRPNMGQGPPGPPRNQTPPVQNMQAYPSTRPQMPGILQAGGPPQGNGRQ